MAYDEYRIQSEVTGRKTQLATIVTELLRVIPAFDRFALSTEIVALVNSAPNVSKQFIETRIAP